MEDGVPGQIVGDRVTTATTLARRAVVLGAWVTIAVAMVAVCRAHEAVRAAAGEEADVGRIANRAWGPLARVAAGSGAVERLARYAGYAAGLAGAAGVVLLSSKVRVRVVAGIAAAAVLGVMAVDRPAGAGGVVSRLSVHAAVGGLALAALVETLKTGRGRGRCLGFTALVVVAVVSGFALAGWRPAQLEDLVRQRRDVAHVIAGAAVLLAPLGLIGRGWGRWARVILVVALAAVLWTGVLMVIDGSDRATPAWWLRGVVIQEAK